MGDRMAVLGQSFAQALAEARRPPCGAVHRLAGAVCTLPLGHRGRHANRHGYWLPRFDEREA